MNYQNYIVYLHSCGFSQNELHMISKFDMGFQAFFEKLSSTSISKVVSSLSRRKKILDIYQGLDTKEIDTILTKLGVSIIVFPDKNYPGSLKNIPNSPYVLYVRGTIPQGDNFGVVGSRKISHYGIKVMRQIIPDISNVFNVVSGGAAGCDTYAHKISIENGGKTIVVVGTGINITYPSGNSQLFEDILQRGGAIVSIFPINEPGNPYNFPIRNEVVVGLSQGILVIEAQEKSGSLITAGLALDLGKDLFSIPGDITLQSSKGTNNLIKKGEAKCVISSYDILEEYNAAIKKTSFQDIVSGLSGLEKDICEVIMMDEQNVDSLSEIMGLEASIIMMKLSLLELKGIIKKSISGNYILR